MFVARDSEWQQKSKTTEQEATEKHANCTALQRKRGDREELHSRAIAMTSSLATRTAPAISVLLPENGGRINVSQKRGPASYAVYR